MIKYIWDRMKALFREPDGFVLIYKRLSVRGGYQWPSKQSEVRNLSWREFDWLMSGIDIDQPKALVNPAFFRRCFPLVKAPFLV